MVCELPNDVCASCSYTSPAVCIVICHISSIYKQLRHHANLQYSETKFNDQTNFRPQTTTKWNNALNSIKHGIKIVQLQFRNITFINIVYENILFSILKLIAALKLL